jgi:hypothetical protein
LDEYKTLEKQTNMRNNELTDSKAFKKGKKYKMSSCGLPNLQSAQCGIKIDSEGHAKKKKKKHFTHYSQIKLCQLT